MNAADKKTLCLSTLLTLATVAAAGCAAGTNTLAVPATGAAIGLPAPSAPASVNTYTGAQSPGVWSFSLNDSNNTYSYQAVTYPSQTPATVSGTMQPSNGFLVLSTGGYALEVKGRAAILRPGDATTPPVFAVPQTSCYAITGRMRFAYIGMWAGTDVSAVASTGPILGYGSLVAGTDTTGASWDLQDLQGYPVLGPTAFSGSCAVSAGEASISLSGDSLLYNYWAPSSNFLDASTSTTQSSVFVGPSGFFVADQSDLSQSSPAGSSVAGIAEPASSLSSTDVASKTYLGFAYQAATSGANFPGSSAVTSPVSFGQVAASGSVMTGGDFPNDDVTQTPNSDMSIALGAESTTTNGFYSAAQMTVLDPYQNCANYTGAGITATSSTNALGYFTCTFPAVAVVGNPEGSYALMITAYNWAARLGGAPLQLYLFQK